MGYFSNVKKLYWLTFFRALIPAYVIERLFSQSRGMTVQMVVYCEIIYALTITLLEIPSGILADKFGRKRMIVIYCALSISEFVLSLLAHDFCLFALSAFIVGVGGAFSSGADNALLYDSLKSSGKQDDFEKILGRVAAMDFIGVTVASLSGSVLANYLGFEFNYIISAVSMCAATLISLTLKEPPMLTKPERELSGVVHYAKQALVVFKSKPLVLLYCLTGAVLGACINYLDEFWQILGQNIGIPVIFFGIFIAVSETLKLPFEMFAYKLKDRFSYNAILTFVMALNIAGYTAIFFVRNIYCVIVMVLITAASGLVEPLIAGYLHRHTESNVRATTESFSSLGLRVLTIGVGLVFGYISTEYSIFSGFLALGLISAVYMIVFRVLKRRSA